MQDEDITAHIFLHYTNTFLSGNYNQLILCKPSCGLQCIDSSCRQGKLRVEYYDMLVSVAEQEGPVPALQVAGF